MQTPRIGRVALAAIVLGTSSFARFEKFERCDAERRGANTRYTGAVVGVARVISLVPSATETIVALHEARRLIARTNYDLEPELAALPSIGGSTDPQIERILMLKPDVVVAWRDLGMSRTVITLDRLGVPTQRVDASSLADVRRMILCVGDLLGARTRADSLVRAIDDSLAALRAQADRRALRSVIYIVWDHPLIVAGGGSFLDSLITFAGGANVFGDTRSEWPTVNFEEVVKRDPDVIIVPSSIGSEAIKRLKFDRRWRALRAARSGRIVVVNGELVSRPGPRVAVAARAIAVALKSVGERP